GPTRSTPPPCAAPSACSPSSRPHPPPGPRASDPPNPHQGSTALVLTRPPFGGVPASRPWSVNGWFALYRPSGGQLSLEPSTPFSCRPGHSWREPPRALHSAVLWSASS